MLNLNVTEKVEEAQKAVVERLSEQLGNIECVLFQRPWGPDIDLYPVAKAMLATAFLAPGINLAVIPAMNWLPIFSSITHDITMTILVYATGLSYLSAVVFTAWTGLATLIGFTAILFRATRNDDGYLRELLELAHGLLTTGCRTMTSRHPIWAAFSAFAAMNWLASTILGVEPVIVGTPLSMFYMISPVVIITENLWESILRFKNSGSEEQ